jgi:hypothetical protein
MVRYVVMGMYTAKTRWKIAGWRIFGLSWRSRLKCLGFMYISMAWDGLFGNAASSFLLVWFYLVIQ